MGGEKLADLAEWTRATRYCYMVLVFLNYLYTLMVRSKARNAAAASMEMQLRPLSKNEASEER